GPPSEDTAPGLEEDFFVETPTAPSAPRPEDLTRGEELPMIAEPLPEMSADIWQDGVQALVSVGDDPAQGDAFPAPDAWADEARFLRIESELALATGATVEA